MKPTIGIYRVWNDVTRNNRPNVRYRRFGRRSYVRKFYDWTEYHRVIRQLKKHGFTTI